MALHPANPVRATRGLKHGHMSGPTSMMQGGHCRGARLMELLSAAPVDGEVNRFTDRAGRGQQNVARARPVSGGFMTWAESQYEPIVEGGRLWIRLCACVDFAVRRAPSATKRGKPQEPPPLGVLQAIQVQLWHVAGRRTMLETADVHKTRQVHVDACKTSEQHWTNEMLWGAGPVDTISAPSRPRSDMAK